VAVSSFWDSIVPWPCMRVNHNSADSWRKIMQAVLPAALMFDALWPLIDPLEEILSLGLLWANFYADDLNTYWDLTLSTSRRNLFDRPWPLLLRIRKCGDLLSDAGQKTTIGCTGFARDSERVYPNLGLRGSWLYAKPGIALTFLHPVMHSKPTSAESSQYR
jgi:hypothetical protein